MLGIGGDNPDSLSGSSGDRVDRSNQFVFDRNPVLEDRHGDLFQTGTKRCTQNQLLLLVRSFFANHPRHRLDSESLRRQGGIVTEQFDAIVQVDFDGTVLAWMPRCEILSAD